MNISTNEYRNYISYKNEIIQCDNLEKLLLFLKESDLFKKIMIDTIKKVQKNNQYINLKNILLKNLKFPTNLSEFNLIKPEDIAFTRLMEFIENSYGEKLIKKEDIKYSDILNMQYTIKVIERYITEKNMINFTPQQYNEAKRLEEEFNKEWPIFKNFIEDIVFN